MNRRISFGITNRAKVILYISALILVINLIQPWTIYGIDSLFISFGLLGLLISGWIVNRARYYVLERIDIKRVLPTIVYEEENIPIIIVIHNPTVIGLYNVLLEDYYPETLSKTDGYNFGVIQIPPKSTVEVKYELKSRGVGSHKFGRFLLRVGDPFGFFHTTLEISDVDTNVIRVMPLIPKISLEEIFARGYRLELGVKKIPHTGLSKEFRDIREYVPGDETRRIDWKATAKLSKLMIREYELERKNHIVMILDLSKNMFIGELGNRKIDYASRTISYIINYAISTKDNVGLIILSGYGVDTIPVAMASETLLRNVLRKMSEIPVYPPVDEYKEWEMRDLGEAISKLGLRDKTLFIVISDLEGPGVIEKIVNLSRILRGLRHEVVIVSPLTVLFEARLLKGVDAAIYRVIGYISMQKRRKEIDMLFRLGVPVINVGPDDLIPYIMLKIEEYRRMIII